jgi:hypothetical protein
MPSFTVYNRNQPLQRQLIELELVMDGLLQQRQALHRIEVSHCRDGSYVDQLREARRQITEAIAQTRLIRDSRLNELRRLSSEANPA